MRTDQVSFGSITGNSGKGRFQRTRARIRPAGLIAAGLVLLAGCSGSDDKGKFAPVEGFAGIVAADEPRAAVVGRDVLGNGGSAVDAAVAMYFTMAVTMPSRASLGGGGVCVVFDSETMAGEAVEFLPRPSASGGLVPSGMRAMAVLHARYGRLNWGRLLAPAETLARFGHAVSRAFAQDLAAEAARLSAEPDLLRLFMARSGRLAQTGDRILQPELSGVLGGIRQQGAGYLHGGPFAGRLAVASSAVGMPLTADEVREAVPRVADAVAVPAGKDVAFFAPPPATGGVVAAQIWQALTEAKTFDDAGEARLHLFAEASARAFAQRAAWMEPDGSSRVPVPELTASSTIAATMADYSDTRHKPSSTYAPPPAEIAALNASAGFVVADRFSNAVACGLTMNQLFGSGRVALGTGIVLAAPPRSPNDGANVLSAVVVGNTKTGDFRFAGAGSGGGPGATALARVMLETLRRGETLDAAMAAPRVHDGGAPDVLLVEPGLSESARADLRRRGHTVREVAGLGDVAAIYCARGLKGATDSCDAAADPRGAGLADRAQ